jgi:prefoldin subunit 5
VKDEQRLDYLERRIQDLEEEVDALRERLTEVGYGKP